MFEALEKLTFFAIYLIQEVIDQSLQVIMCYIYIYIYDLPNIFLYRSCFWSPSEVILFAISSIWDVINQAIYVTHPHSHIICLIFFYVGQCSRPLRSFAICRFLWFKKSLTNLSQSFVYYAYVICVFIFFSICVVFL